MNQNRMGQDEAQLLEDRHWTMFFNRCDTNGDGFISYNELIQMIDNGDGTEIPRHVVRKVHKRADSNGDGLIDYQEFIAMVQNPDNKLLFSHHFPTIEKFSQQYFNLVPRRNYSQDTTDSEGDFKYNCCPPPLGMLIISIIEIIFFILDESQDGVIANKMILDPVKRYEVWRFLTYMFVHIGYMHLVVNILVQLMLGISLEIEHRWWRVLIIYFAGVVAGSLGTTVFDPTAELAGASGGVYALITAHIATLFLNWSEKNKVTYPLVQMIIYLIVIIVDTGTSIYERYYLDINKNIGYVAHFGGTLAGLLVGIMVLRNFTVTKTEIYVKHISLTLFVLLMGTGIIINLAWTSHYPKKRYPKIYLIVD